MLLLALAQSTMATADEAEGRLEADGSRNGQQRKRLRTHSPGAGDAAAAGAAVHASDLVETLYNAFVEAVDGPEASIASVS